MTNFVTVATAAQLLQCNRRSILRYLESGDLAGVQVKTRGWWRISRASLQRKLDELDKLDTSYTDSSV